MARRVFRETRGGLPAHIAAACVDDRGKVFVAGAMGAVLRSDDLGKSFVASRVGGYVPSMWCSPRGGALVVAASGEGVFRSTDDGATFVRAACRAKHVEGLAGSDGGEVVVAGLRGVCQRSLDEGRAFSPIKTGVRDFIGWCAVDGASGIYLLGQGFVLSSADSGASFRAHRARGEGYFRAAAAFADGRVIVVGDGGRVLTSRDGGRSWATRRVGKGDFHGIWGPSPDDLWAVAGGRVLHSDDGGQSFEVVHDAGPLSLEVITGRPGGLIVAAGVDRVLVAEPLSPTVRARALQRGVRCAAMRRSAPALVVSIAAFGACAQATAPPPAPAPAPSAPAVEGYSAMAPPSVSASASASASAPPRPSYEEPEVAPLPAGFVAIEREGATMCDSLKVEVLREPGMGFQRFVRVSAPGGKKVYEAHGRKYKLDTQTDQMDLWGEFCGDLTGDGVPELVMTERTIGAHCCYTHYIVSLTTPSKRLMMWEKGDAGTEIRPEKYGQGRAWQVEGSMVFWPPFDPESGDPSVSYAGAPLVPVVFSLVGDEYKMMSLSYPQAYRKSRDALVAHCKKDPDCWGELMMWLDSLAIGDWDEVKKQIVPDAELRKRLDIRAAQTLARMKATLGGVQPPRAKR